MPPRNSTLLALAGAVCLAAAQSFPADDLTHSEYRALRASYRDGSYRDAARRMLTFELPSIRARNDELPETLDLESRVDRRQIALAVTLNAESARRAPDARRLDFFLDQALRLSAHLPGREQDELRRKSLLAVAHSLFRRYRATDALRILGPAAKRFPEDEDTQFAYGTAAELVGWMEDSNALLDAARVAYARVIDLDPQNARAEVRHGRVVMLLGADSTTGVEALEQALERLEQEDDVYRVIASMTLGDHHRSRGELEAARARFSGALELDPTCQAAAVALSHVLRRLGEVDRAASVVLRSAASDSPFAPPDSWLSYRLGDSTRENDFWRDLRSHYE